jgi:hypothetical protein
MSNALLCQQRLSVLEEDYAILARGPHTHDCILELAGVCPICESYMDMREEIGEMIREERALLPGYYEAQTKQRTAYVCKEMVRPLATSLDDRIVALARLILKDNGQRETAADLR